MKRIFQSSEWFGDVQKSNWDIATQGEGPAGKLPLNDQMLRELPSGDLFGLTQNAGMGWDVQKMLGPQFLLLSTQGGMRAENGTPIALGYIPDIGKLA